MGYSRSKKLGTLLSVFVMLGVTGVSVYFFSSENNIGDNRSQSLGMQKADFNGNGQTTSGNKEHLNDKVPPTVAIKNPILNTKVNKNAEVIIHVDAVDPAGISKVDFFVEGALICTDLVQLYTCKWKAPAISKKYTIQAKAYDNSGNVAVADSAVFVN